jgi:hypothetical protein
MAQLRRLASLSLAVNNLGVFLRAPTHTGMYDPALKANLVTWYDLTQKGVATAQYSPSPLRFDHNDVIGNTLA